MEVNYNLLNILILNKPKLSEINKPLFLLKTISQNLAKIL